MFEAPIDLSDLPGYHTARAQRPARTAFIGRCSTKDNQDPRSSIAGQLAEASVLLEPGQRFAAHYWDVESGMLGLDERGKVTPADYAKLGVPVPRDGGLPELLEAAERDEIDRVACERISRVARDMLTSLLVEARLKRCGVPLECANEPRGGGMSTGLLEVRRSAQVRAEITRHELLEMSMRGQRQHAATGYQHGPPCYGYIAVVDPAAGAAANRFGGGRPKQRLELHPDERRAATVAEAFRLRREEQRGDADIAAVLAADLDRYPLAEGQKVWHRRRVRRMLSQPKYTGFQIYGRCAARTNHGRLNPMAQWVWSRRQAHPAITPLEEWHETQRVTMRMSQRRTPGWKRVNAAADEYGLPLAQVRETDTHLLYEVGGRRIVVPRGELPAAVAEEIITMMQQAR